MFRFVDPAQARPAPPTDVRYRINRIETDLSDAEWDAIRELLPPQKPRVGRPAQDHRTVVNAILWVTCSGNPWRSLPSRYGKWTTASSRYHRWLQAGIWPRVAAALAAVSPGESPAPNGLRSNALTPLGRTSVLGAFQ